MTDVEIPEQGPGRHRGSPRESLRAKLLLEAAARHTPWLQALLDLGEDPDGIGELARHLADVRAGTPSCLGLIAEAYLEHTSTCAERSLYRANAPRARTDDPETSQEAAEKVRGPAKPGGSVHRLLEAYVDHARMHPREAGLTSREVEGKARVRAAHKRTSELLADGLLVVVTVEERYEAQMRADGVDPAQAIVAGVPLDKLNDPATRGGGRILRVTGDGRRELARLDRALNERALAAKAKAAKKAAREARRRS